jgi:hypothetical protein
MRGKYCMEPARSANPAFMVVHASGNFCSSSDKRRMRSQQIHTNHSHDLCFPPKTQVPCTYPHPERISTEEYQTTNLRGREYAVAPPSAFAGAWENHEMAEGIFFSNTKKNKP